MVRYDFFSFYERFLFAARYQLQSNADLSPVEFGSSPWHPPGMLKPANEAFRRPPDHDRGYRSLKRRC